MANTNTTYSYGGTGNYGLTQTCQQYPQQMISSSTTPSTPWFLGTHEDKPFAMDEELIMIDWARRRGNTFASEMQYRISMWQSIQQLKQMTSGPFYYPGPWGPASSSSTITYGGTSIQADPSSSLPWWMGGLTGK